MLDVIIGAEFGHFIGQSTKEQIIHFYNSAEGCPVFQEILKISPSFQQFIVEYFNAHTVVFPTIQEEVIAMANALDVDHLIVFIQNACSELYLLFGDDVEVTSNPCAVNDPPIYAPYLCKSERKVSPDLFVKNSKTSQRREHCSDIGLIYSDEASITRVMQGHNEDWWSGVADKMSVVQAGDWMGYLYPGLFDKHNHMLKFTNNIFFNFHLGQFPGTSFVVNSHGLSISMNSLYPSVPGYVYSSSSSYSGVAYVFAYVLRDIIRSSTTSDVISKLYRHPIYSGYSLNVMSSCETSITNIEGYGDRVGVQSRSGDLHVDSVVGHFNYYINSVVDQEFKSTSIKRKMCQENTSFHSPVDVRKFLGDLDCPVFFTDLNGNHGSETLSTWLADPVSKECRRYRLPHVCEKYQSRCMNESAASHEEPVVYKWKFSCD